MSILIAEDNNAQRHYLSELLAREFSAHAPVIEAVDGEDAVTCRSNGVRRFVFSIFKCRRCRA